MSSISTAFAPSPKYPNVKIVARPSKERGHANHGWLKTFHTFSFASYQDSKYMSFGPLRVINEDRVEPSTGFGQHSHREMEIFSYVVSGELEHKDSMGNLEILKRGDLQMTSAGTGISHSEYNRNKSQQVHFLQIWVQPSESRLKPNYFTRNISDDQKRDKLVQIVGPVGAPGVITERESTGPAPVHAPVSLFATILSPSASVSHTFPKPGANTTSRKSYIHVIQTSGFNDGEAKGARVKLNGGLELSEGDGAFVLGQEGEAIELENVGSVNAEVLVFDIE